MKDKKSLLPISIIIPTYKRYDILEQVLPSYLEQPVREIIIIDDCTPGDEFKSILLKDERIVYKRLNTNMGTAMARNVGVYVSSEPYIVFGEDDLCFDAETCKEAFNKLLEKDSADILGMRVIYLKNNEETEEALKRVEKMRMKFWEGDLSINSGSPFSQLRLPLIQAICIMKKEIALSVLYDVTWSGNALWEETDFYIRAQKRGFTVGYIPSAKSYHLPPVRRGGNHSIGVFKRELSIIKNTKKFFSRHSLYLKNTWGIKETCASWLFKSYLSRVIDRLRKVAW